MAKKATKTSQAEVLPALPEQSFAVDESRKLSQFFGGIVTFFRDAAELERTATDLVAKARLLTLPQPGDVDGDAALQLAIRDASSQKKAIESHWTICSVVFQFHRRLTAGRDRGAKLAQEAMDIPQRLHNQFVQDAKRRAEEEQRRLQREEEARQQAERRAELARLEAAAADAEAASPDLSERERALVVMLVNRGVTGGLVSQRDIENAATAVGYRDTNITGKRLAKVVTAIDAMASAKAIREQAQAVEQTPIDTSRVETVKVQKASVGVDRTTRSAELLDERKLVMAVIEGTHGIPTDILTINTAALNRYARDLGEVINRWPGVRMKETTRTV